MLASFFHWWVARISELLPTAWTDAAVGARDGVVVDMHPDGSITTSIRKKGRPEPVTLGVAARFAARNPVLVRPPPEAVLEKEHVVPTLPRRELDQLLRHELARITPFATEDLFWRWDGRVKSSDRGRTSVTLTMVPKTVLAAALEMVASAGIRPRFVEVGPAQRPRLLAMDDAAAHTADQGLVRALGWACAGLAVVALVLPVVLQERALRATNGAIDDLQPAIRQVDGLRRGITAEGAGREVLAEEMQRTGDLLQILATITRILPDDTYLTDFSLRDRHLTLGGRSAAAARLITSLSADPAIHDAAFAAPVTRLEGATTDVFSIRAEVAP